MLFRSDQLLDRINREIVSFLNNCTLPELDLSHLRPMQLPESDAKKLQTSRTEGGAKPGTKGAAPIRVEKKVGRKDPCPCGSGKKFKNCHGQGE